MMFDIFDRRTLEIIDRVSAKDAADAVDIISKARKIPRASLLAVMLGFSIADLPPMRLVDE